MTCADLFFFHFYSQISIVYIIWPHTIFSRKALYCLPYFSPFHLCEDIFSPLQRLISLLLSCRHARALSSLAQVLRDQLSIVEDSVAVAENATATPSTSTSSSYPSSTSSTASNSLPESTQGSVSSTSGAEEDDFSPFD